MASKLTFNLNLGQGILMCNNIDIDRYSSSGSIDENSANKVEEGVEECMV